MKQYFRYLVTALIMLATFLLPVKLGGIAGVPETTGLFSNQLWVYLIITWPVFLFPFLTGILLLLTLLAFPFSPGKDAPSITVFWWVFLAFAALPGIIGATVWDFVIMEIIHLFGLAAYALSVYLLLRNLPGAGKLLTFSLLAGLAAVLYAGLEQYFSGFAEMRQYIAHQEKTGGLYVGEALKARIFDDRVSAPFTGCNSLAGYLLLTGPLGLVVLWKWCARVEPPGAARLIFMPLAAACLMFVFFATKARGAFLSLILAAGVFIIIFPVKKWLRRAVIILAPLAVIGGVIYICEFGRGFQSMIVRLDYLQVSAKLLLNQPLTGTGWGDFFYDYMRLKAVDSPEAPHTPHNLLLACGGEAGIFALLAAAGALFYPFRTGFKKIRPLIAGHHYLREEVALFFGLTAFIFHAMMDIDLQVPGLIGTAAAVTLLLVMPSEIARPEKARPLPRLIAASIALLIALTAIGGGWHLVRSEYILSKLTDLCQPNQAVPAAAVKVNPYEVGEKLEAAVRARPYSPFPYSMAGAFYLKTGHFGRAESCYKKALQLAPHCAAYHFRLFTLQELQGRRAEAEKHLLQANELFPNHPEYRRAKTMFIGK
ncbi:MAG: O-antigen ligase family protein [Victivallaceae bacterium]|nr:O-antigen ligase family protein [Victivallaceae bacterium]